MKKVISLLAVILLFSMSACSQVTMTITDISLKSSGTESFESYDTILVYEMTFPYMKIEVEMYNESSELFYLNKSRFIIEYQYNGATNIAECMLKEPIFNYDSQPSIPPKSSLKVLLVIEEGLPTDNYIAKFNEIYPTIIVKHVNDDMSRIYSKSEPIKFHSMSIKSASQE